MKALFITINILLGILVVWAGIRRLEMFSGKKPQEFTVKKVQEKKPAAKPAAPQKKTERSPEQDAEVVLAKNVFSQDRSPNASMGGNARVELSLVGTFSIGDCVGAIIKQKAASRNNNFFPMGGPPMPGGGRQMGIGPRGGNAPGGNQRGGNQRGGNSRGGNPRFPGGGMPQMMAARQQGSSASGNNQLVYKQYVRLGETLSNGYKLINVEREKVTLQRGSDKLELVLEEASKNAPQTARQTTRRVNTATRLLQTMQNMQRMQMFQNFQMMRMMNRNNQNNNNNNNNANMNGGSRGGRNTGYRSSRGTSRTR